MVKNHLEDGVLGRLPHQIYMATASADSDAAIELINAAMSKRKRDTREMVERALDLDGKKSGGADGGAGGKRVPLSKVVAAAKSLDVELTPEQYETLDPDALATVNQSAQQAHKYLQKIADRNLDKMECYLLRNIFHIPSNLIVDDSGHMDLGTAAAAGAAGGGAGGAAGEGETAEGEAALSARFGELQEQLRAGHHFRAALLQERGEVNGLMEQLEKEKERLAFIPEIMQERGVGEKLQQIAGQSEQLKELRSKMGEISSKLEKSGAGGAGGAGGGGSILNASIGGPSPLPPAPGSTGSLVASYTTRKAAAGAANAGDLENMNALLGHD
jgi:hypothetical protein